MSEIDFQELLSYLQAEAIANTLAPSEGSIWRSICRVYSRRFNTPLHIALQLDPEIVALNVYEDKLEQVDLEEDFESIVEMLRSVEDPDYDTKKEQQLEDDIKRYEKEEEERVKAGRPVHPSLKGQTSVKETIEKKEENKELPKSGFIDLSRFSKEDSES